ncbi:CHAT domain-containing protein [Actinokineospora alba]|uniref:CHAT domain-containing protein n=1 Tax=Actinokineospora alba TaxID=504798 RepID=A0A1H0H870_9PSEU|nr:CHAT domain-containing protein [Actinokineospora alba]TDP64995.1 CHAT domain-containing protein [Actinokineospora alba]SDH51516.1 CHAT domain-containing protein [Actinokineospora alba]SDO15335.1 CHAT domain-containing protein [Actinokineospora alba]
MRHSEREQLINALATPARHADAAAMLRSLPKLGWLSARRAKRLRQAVLDALARDVPAWSIVAMLGGHDTEVVVAAMAPLVTDGPDPGMAAHLLLTALRTRPSDSVSTQPRPDGGHWGQVDPPVRKRPRIPPREHIPPFVTERPNRDLTSGDPPSGGWGTGAWRPPWLEQPSKHDPTRPVTPANPPDDVEPFEDFSPGPPSAREVWPTLECPASVDIDAQFDLTVGIGPKQDMALLGTGPITLPNNMVRLEIVLMYDPTAFAPVGWSNPVVLTVDAENPYPVATLRMTALRGESLRSRRDIGASFYVDGGLRGYASRAIEVTGTPSGTVPLFGGAMLDIGPLLKHEAPDLVVVVERGEDLRGQTLLWSTRSSVPGVASAPGPYRSEIGEDPAAFARRVRLDVGAFGGDARGSTLKLIGVGRTIADHIPDEVCAALTAVSTARAPAPATVLLLSSEPHVPWELAVLDPPPAEGSPFLGARMAIGRWVLARKRPRPTPPTEVRADRHIVVTARYEGVPGWARLPFAEAEAERLRLTYPPAVEVQPLHSAVLDCLEAGPDGGVLHFALHGKYDPENAQDGLVLLAPSEANPDRLVPRFLQPDQVSAMAFSSAPFVFLNACQVGAAGEVLGDYSGLAKAFLAAGAAGVVAPLWNVNDEAASALADAFYQDAYGPQALAPAEILRRARAEVSRDHYPTWPATTLAYQFFGHPRLRLRRDQGA